MTWKEFEDLTYDPRFQRKVRKAVGFLALAMTIFWLVSCTVLGMAYR